MELEWNPAEAIVPRGYEILGVAFSSDGTLTITCNGEDVVKSYCPGNFDESVLELWSSEKVWGLVDVYGGAQRRRTGLVDVYGGAQRRRSNGE